ncbi:uncharacterized protein O3C94_007494 [Discoglossus pictus]
MALYNPMLCSLIILSAISFICTVVLNALSATSVGGLFLSTAKNVSDKYSLEITPAGWTFSIWSVIYIWNGLWIIYVVSTIFRRNNLGRVYLQPTIHPPEFFALWILNNIINIGWLFLWDREYIVPSMIFLVLIPVTVIMMLIISYKNCYKHGEWLSKNHPVDLWCTRILVHNGLATYVTWTSIASFLNFGLVLKYEEALTDIKASTVVLCMVFFVLLFWFLLESFVFEKYVRHTFTIYPVAIVASVGVFSGRTHATTMSSNDVINIALIIVTAAACLLRFASLFLCDKIRPLYSKIESSPSDEELKVPVSDAQTAGSNGIVNPVAMEMTES